MYEPKYKLNKKDDQRWHDLLIRHCTDQSNMTQEEVLEFEVLQKKRHDKVVSHPKVQESLKAQARWLEEVQDLLKKLENLNEESR